MVQPATTSHPPPLDVSALERWQRIAPADSAWLHEEVGRRMQQRLDWIVQQPAAWLDWEPLRGGAQAHDLVAARYPGAQQWLLLASPQQQQAARARWQSGMFERLRGRGRRHFSAPPPASMDMVWANMALHQSTDPAACFSAWADWLKEDGFVMFSCLGPDTLMELRALYAQLGWPPPAQAFTDMHDWGDMLLGNGFAAPVMDMERISLSFASPQRLLQELRELGRNLHPGRFAGLRTRQWRERLLSALQGMAGGGGAGGEICLTFEVIYGHAFKVPPRNAVTRETSISLEDMRRSLRQR